MNEWDAEMPVPPFFDTGGKEKHALLPKVEITYSVEKSSFFLWLPFFLAPFSPSFAHPFLRISFIAVELTYCYFSGFNLRSAQLVPAGDEAFPCSTLWPFPAFQSG